MGFGHVGKTIKPGCEIAVLPGLDQAEMAFRQSERRIARNGANDGHTQFGNGVGDHLMVSRAADAIEHNAGNANIRIVGGKAAHHGRSRLRLGRDIEHQQHRQFQPRGKVRRGAATAGDAGHAVEQAHGAFNDEDFRVTRGIGHQRIDQRRRHRPAVEIDAASAGCGGVERAIDVIGPGFRRAHRHAAAGEGFENAQGNDGLAGTRTRRRNQQRARGHEAVLLERFPIQLAQKFVMAGPVPAIHVFPAAMLARRGCPGRMREDALRAFARA